MKGWEDVELCPLCGSTGSLIDGTSASGAMTVPFMGIEAQVGVLLRYVYCVNCGLTYQNPRLDEESTRKFYESGFYREFELHTTQEMDNGEMERAKRIAALVHEFVPSYDSHLDIGCSRGFLLNELHAPNRMGVDFNPDYRSDRSLVVMDPGKFDGTTYQFDLITVIHVLEHVRHPVAWLMNIVHHLKPNGTLVVEVPWKISKFGLAHPLVFNPPALMRVLQHTEIRPFRIAVDPHLCVLGTRA